MTDNNKIKFALNFPQGLIFFMEGQKSYNNPEGTGSAYFIPRDNMDAFMASRKLDAFLIYGEHKELFGKHAIKVSKDKETGAEAYSVVYEFNKDTLVDARLVTKDETIRGTRVPHDDLTALETYIKAKMLNRYKPEDPQLGKIFNAASFPDGRILVQLQNRDIYLGTPGNYRKLETTGGFNAGSSTWRNTVQGDKIALPHGQFGPDDNEGPAFNDQKLTYLDKESLSKIDFKPVAGITHIRPFEPEAKAPAPKGPAR